MSFQTLLILLAIAALLWALMRHALRVIASENEAKKSRNSTANASDSDSRSGNRKSDSMILGGAEKAAYLQAQRLAKEGNHLSAAKILEKMGLYREAIVLLEGAGCIHDAADILMSMKLPHRAGHMLARHELWAAALVCFREAKLPAEILRCSKNLATERGLVSPDHIQAAGLSDLRNHLGAARLYLRGNAHDQAYAEYLAMARAPSLPDPLILTDKEVDFLISKICELGPEPAMVDLLVSKGLAANLLQALLLQNLSDMARIVLERSQDESLPLILGSLNLETSSKKILAELLLEMERYEQAGLLFEQTHLYEAAGTAFANAKNHASAARCFDKAQLSHRAAEMRFLNQSEGNELDNYAPTESDAAPKDITREIDAGGYRPSSPLASEFDSFSMLESSLGDIPRSYKALKLTQTVPSQTVTALFDSFHKSTNSRIHESELKGYRIEKIGSNLEVTNKGNGYKLFLILSGTVEVLEITANGNEVVIDELHPNAMFGKAANPKIHKRKLKFRATTNCRLATIAFPEGHSEYFYY